jgi:hypothetical protein
MILHRTPRADRGQEPKWDPNGVVPAETNLPVISLRERGKSPKFPLMDSVRAKNLSDSLIGKPVGGWLIQEFCGAGKSAIVMRASASFLE